ncbi:olfactory receptor 15-like [Heterocephalus glaber]|nr:olfactory receptor 15-like [Heterocephalus glaber]
MALLSYLLTLVGNISIILFSLVHSRLQTPMYFFLDNLALLDLSVTCAIMPHLLANLWGPDKTTEAWGCILQVYIFSLAACTECILLAMMAIDRYLAICQPLQYTLIMHPWVCVQMAAASWSSGLANSVLPTTLTLQLLLCGQHILDNIYKVPVVNKLVCRDTSANELKRGGSFTGGHFSTFIVRAALKLPSAEGRHKALSTCSYNLVVVTLYFGPAI